MYRVTYINLRGEIKTVRPGANTAAEARATVLSIYNDVAAVLYVRNIYSGKIG